MNFIRIIGSLLLTLLIASCNSINSNVKERQETKNSSTTKVYRFLLLLVDEKRAMNIEKLTQKDAEAFGDIILTDSRDKNMKYLLKAKSLIDNSMIDKAEVAVNEFGAGYLIHIEFSEEGKKIFSKFTAKNVGKRVAMVFNSKVYSVPTILEEISAGKVEITGDFSMEKASEIVNSINLHK